MQFAFTIVLRGYDIAEVDRVLTQADEAVSSGSDSLRSAAREVLRDTNFRMRLRGYDRSQVDEAIRDRTKRLA
nr:DivIVA domain-containing protein [Micromonospora sp. DSM 115978]